MKFQAIWLDLKIKGIIRHNEYLNSVWQHRKSPMLMALAVRQYREFIYNEGVAMVRLGKRPIRQSLLLISPMNWIS